MTVAGDLWSALDGDPAILAQPAAPDVPAIALNMVMSVDGATTVGGRVGGLTGPADQALLYRLRAESDAVLVGAGTVRAEGYGHLLPPDERERRVRLRGAAEPPLCVVTRDPRLLAGTPALRAAPSPLILLTTAGVTLPPAQREVVLLGDDAPRPPGRRLPLRPLLQRLAAEHGVRRIVCEGGPTLNATLLAEGLVAELFVAVSPVLTHQLGALKLVAGGGEPVRVELVAAAVRGGFVFTRYRPRGSTPPARSPA